MSTTRGKQKKWAVVLFSLVQPTAAAAILRLVCSGNLRRNMGPFISIIAVGFALSRTPQRYRTLKDLAARFCPSQVYFPGP